MVSLIKLKDCVSINRIFSGCFTIGLVFTTGAGEYWLGLFDNYGAMGLTLIAFIEIVSIMYVYGHERFTNDIKNMTGVRPGLYWQLTWRFIAPSMLFVILVASLIKQFEEHPEYDAWIMELGKTVKKKFPGWTLGVGAILALSSVMPIFIIGILRATGISQPHVDYEPGSPMKRVETNASTHPMMVITFPKVLNPELNLFYQNCRDFKIEMSQKVEKNHQLAMMKKNHLNFPLFLQMILLKTCTKWRRRI